MFEPIKDLPAGVVGFEAVGKVTAADYEKTLIPAANETLAGGHKLRFLYFVGPRFDGFEFGAAVDDATWGLRHAFDFEKVAFVSDNVAITTAVRPLGVLMPFKLRVFANKDLAAAKAWLAE